MKRTAPIIALVLAGLAPALTACAPGSTSGLAGSPSTPTSATCARDASLAAAASSANTIVLLTDGPSPAFTQVVDKIANDPQSAFGSEDLDLSGQPGTVAILTYDGTGAVTPEASFDLAGSGYGLNQSVDASLAASCLRLAAGHVPGTSTGGDLLRALPQAARYSTSKMTGIIAFGLGQASGSGFTVATAVLDTPAARSYVIKQLSEFGLLPD
ncbi:MAG: hypothetical protein ACREHV_17530, partial [Rhizomicrobium sp.]